MEACEKLGGPYVSTPRAIEYVMNVQGLTAAHIKSHLQKYRKAFRKKGGKSESPSGTHSGRSNDPETTQSLGDSDDAKAEGDELQEQNYAQQGIQPMEKASLADFGQGDIFNMLIKSDSVDTEVAQSMDDGKFIAPMDAQAKKSPTNLFSVGSKQVFHSHPDMAQKREASQNQEENFMKDSERPENFRNYTDKLNLEAGHVFNAVRKNVVDSLSGSEKPSSLQGLMQLLQNRNQDKFSSTKVGNSMSQMPFHDSKYNSNSNESMALLNALSTLVAKGNLNTAQQSIGAVGAAASIPRLDVAHSIRSSGSHVSRASEVSAEEGKTFISTATVQSMLLIIDLMIVAMKEQARLQRDLATSSEASASQLEQLKKALISKDSSNTHYRNSYPSLEVQGSGSGLKGARNDLEKMNLPSLLNYARPKQPEEHAFQSRSNPGADDDVDKIIQKYPTGISLRNSNIRFGSNIQPVTHSGKEETQQVLGTETGSRQDAKDKLADNPQFQALLSMLR